METNKHGKGGSAFFWGLIIGALLASLLATKKGRQILRDITDLGLELIEDLIEEKKQARNSVRDESGFTEADVEEAGEDLESEIAEEEIPVESVQMGEKELKEEAEVKEPKTASTNGHTKKRLFRGIRKSK